MTLRDGLLPVFQNARGLMQGFGLRTTRVFVRTETWSSGTTGKGPSTVNDVEILPRPKVIDRGNDIYEVTKITPKNEAGTVGWTTTQLAPPTESGSTVVLVLLGPDNVEKVLRIYDTDDRRNFTYTIFGEEMRKK